MKKLLNLLYSTRLMGILFIVFATAMAIATFIENDYGTQTAKALVYNTWWFEAIMLFFVFNFFGNIFKYKLYRKEKWAVLFFHTAFLFILIGAGITRYIGYEGLMLIKEGETTNQFLSERTYLNVIIDNGKDQKPTIHKELLLSSWGKNNVNFTEDFKGQEIIFNLINYIPNAEKKFRKDTDGNKFLFFVESSEGSRHEHYIKKGTVQNIHNVLVGFNVKEQVAINFIEDNGVLKIKSTIDGNWFRMADEVRGKIVKDSVQIFNYLSLHNIAGLQFVIPRPAEKGTMKVVSNPKKKNNLDVVVFDITTNNKTKRVEFAGTKYNASNSKEFSIDNLNFRALYGSKILKTPFSIKLNDFQLKKYPGSESAASYASEVTVIAPEETFDFRIYMNHILNYKGYKFFQSSYDISGPVEETHLSVNHDFWGSLITYIGYFMLYAGLLAIFFVKGTRFYDLRKMLNKIRNKKATLTLLVFFFSFGWIQAQHTENHQKNNTTSQQIDSILKANVVAISHTEKFNSLIIQDDGGRMKPVHTFASELVRKVSKQEKFHGMEPGQVLLSILENPRFWFEVPFIYLEKGNTKIREDLGVAKDVTHASLSNFLTSTGKYKIREQVANAQKKNIKNKFEKDLIHIDKRVGLLYSAISGSIFRIFPIPNDKNHKWISPLELNESTFKGTDSVFVKQIIPVYIQVLDKAKKENNYTEADQLLDGIKKFQKKFGKAIYPKEKQIHLEITYNKIEIFNRLAKYYGFVSLLFIFFVMIQIFSSKKWINTVVKSLVIVVSILWISHTLGLTARWYISGNAPWSNAYESIIFVAWATMLFGLVFGKKSSLTIAATTFLTAIILAFAHQNWLDPQIANLQPVLNSWWLMVHVSVIVASYGPFSLGMILAIFALILTVFTTEKNKKKLNLVIQELTIIIEMALTVGVVMLTIGNFLGGMWANESWGRYWGWDPKETWALISIMVYGFILHMRLIPGLRGRIAFNFAAAIGYLSIMMTYFGVNFYLSGLHSYASGDQSVTPREAYYFIAFLIIITLLAQWKHQKYFKKKK